MKKVKLFLLLPLLLFSLSVCSAEEFEESPKTHYVNMAQTVIGLFNDAQTEEIRSFSSKEFNAALDDQRLQDIYEHIKLNGTLESFADSRMECVPQGGKAYTVIVQHAKHSVNDLVYTVSFDENRQLAGFYYRPDDSLPSDANKRYTKMAQDVIVLFNSGQKKKIRNRSSALFNEALDDETLQLVCKFLKSCGPVTSFTKSEAKKAEQNGELYTVVIQHAKYSNKEIIFTISFDVNDKLAGFYYY